MQDLPEKLFDVFRNSDFLEMNGLVNEVPIFIQSYDPASEDFVRQMVASLTSRLLSAGVCVKSFDLFELILEELDEWGILGDLLRDERDFSKADLLDTLQNFSDPKTHLIPRLMQKIGDLDTQLSLLTGSGRLFPFLRTHTILESLQPAMLRHPVVIFFPGQYNQNADSGSQLKLFGCMPTPGIQNAYYRAINLDHYRLKHTS